MNRYGIKSKLILIYITVFSLVAVSLFSGCSVSREKKLKKKIIKMSDKELLGYYHGINDRLKDIDNNLKTPHPAMDHNQEKYNHRVYEDGIPAYDLMKKKKLVQAELRRRNIRP